MAEAVEGVTVGVAEEDVAAEVSIGGASSRDAIALDYRVPCLLHVHGMSNIMSSKTFSHTY